MKRNELFFTSILVPLDFIAIFLAGLSAYYLRFAKMATSIRPVNFELEFYEYIKALLVIDILWIAIFAFAGLYRFKNPIKGFVKEFYRIFLACSTGFLLIVVLIFLRRELFDSRFIVLAGLIFAILYLTITRSIVRAIQSHLMLYGMGVRRIVIVGSSKSSDILMQEFSSKRKYGYEVVKRLRDFSIETADQLEENLPILPFDEIIQADPNLSKVENMRLLDFADDHHITFKYSADILGTKALQTEVTEIAGIPIVEVIRTPLEGWGRITKRIFDVVVSLVLILIISPVLLITAVVIKLDSYGPVFFSRKDDGSPLYRVGQGGKLFRYFKFRSMRPDSDSLRYTELADRNTRGGPMVKIKDDPRITRVGKFIRRYSIDELSELFLVFRGDMSLVGPRPHLPEEVAKYEHHHKKVLTIKPGITGLAQVSGRSDLSFEEEVKLDTYYIENWSLLKDLAILLKTPIAVLRSRSNE